MNMKRQGLMRDQREAVEGVAGKSNAPRARSAKGFADGRLGLTQPVFRHQKCLSNFPAATFTVKSPGICRMRSITAGVGRERRSSRSGRS